MNREEKAYSPEGWLVLQRFTDSEGEVNSTAFQHDAVGRVVSASSGDGQVIERQYNGKGELIFQRGDGYPVAYHLEGGRPTGLTTYTDSANLQGAATTQWSYAPGTNQVESKLYADGQGDHHTVLPGGQLASSVSASGRRVDYSYTELGQLQRVSYGDDSAALGYHYGRDGQVSAIDDGAGRRDFVYGEAGTLDRESFSSGPLQGLDFSLEHDGDLRRTGLELRDSGSALTALQQRYDQDGRLAGLSFGELEVSYGYDNSGRITHLDLNQSGASVISSQRSYKGRSALGSLAFGDDSGSLQRFDYRLDASQRRQRMTHSDGSYWLYAHDAEGQLSKCIRRTTHGSVRKTYVYRSW